MICPDTLTGTVIGYGRHCNGIRVARDVLLSAANYAPAFWERIDAPPIAEVAAAVEEHW